ncbi:MAG: hypothetical protein QOD06_317, partial [Candidatus Binatota bacterium]|nr:hypothetical protein [Candidatus Binatota bacterium]
MKTWCAFLVTALMLAGASLAGAVSDGNYSSHRQHCTANVDNSDEGERTELHCHNATLTLRDGAGHEYFGIGTQHIADGSGKDLPVRIPVPFVGSIVATIVYNPVDVWYDLDDGTGCHIYTFTSEDPQHPKGPEPCNFIDWRVEDPEHPGAYRYVANPKSDPASGLRLYFGADDNLAGGEHDSSEQVSNGPSDGGAVVLNVDPATIASWVARLTAGDARYVLTHPLPLADGGVGACADGVCFSVQSQQRERTYPDGTPSGKAVANYQDRQWDPEGCSGPSDGTKNGQPTASHPCGDHYGDLDGDGKPDNAPLRYWNEVNGDPTVDPGIQVYEDPDAQGSPLGPYPLPA